MLQTQVSQVCSKPGQWAGGEEGVACTPFLKALQLAVYPWPSSCAGRKFKLKCWSVSTYQNSGCAFHLLGVPKEQGYFTTGK